jgi:hypothetical protein
MPISLKTAAIKIFINTFIKPTSSFGQHTQAQEAEEKLKSSKALCDIIYLIKRKALNSMC